MNSRRIIEVDKVWCGSCQESFYELRSYELSHCPHCNRPLDNPEVDHSCDFRIEVDFKTGDIKSEKV